MLPALSCLHIVRDLNRTLQGEGMDLIHGGVTPYYRLDVVVA
jgi:hypothetical protein